MSTGLLTLLFSVVILSCTAENVARNFPEKFLFGVSTSAYQIEGAWNESGKGESIWDHLLHKKPELVDDRTNGDVACDSFHQYKRDVEMIAYLGVHFYRFSISWTRLLPSGFSNEINEDGVKYYTGLINELLKYNITPIVTIYHWDLPQTLQNLGGWANPLIANYYEDYADVVFRLFGDKVKTWLTFNEPQVFCSQGYGLATMAPALDFDGIADYLCSKTVLLAHAKAYHLYDSKYRNEQKGKVGLSLSSSYHQPASDSKEDIDAANRFLEFELGWFAHPIFSEEGDFPSIMKTNIAKYSLNQGYARSRLPHITLEEVEFIRGTADFFGLNHYTTYITGYPKSKYDFQSYYVDVEADSHQDPNWPSGISYWMKVVPSGFRKLLNWITNSYNDVKIIVFECGYSDSGVINDSERIEFYRLYLNSLLDAIEDGCNVIGFSAWSLMDNFEWFRGYKEHFGLFHVHRDTPNMEREPKESAKYFKEIVRTKHIENLKIQLT